MGSEACPKRLVEFVYDGIFVSSIRTVGLVSHVGIHGIRMDGYDKSSRETLRTEDVRHFLIGFVKLTSADRVLRSPTGSINIPFDGQSDRFLDKISVLVLFFDIFKKEPKTFYLSPTSVGCISVLAVIVSARVRGFCGGGFSRPLGRPRLSVAHSKMNYDIVGSS